MFADKEFIKCRYLDENGQPKGKEYTFGCNFKVAPGDYVYAMMPYGEKKLIVTAINVPGEEVVAFRDNLKSVSATSVMDLQAKEQ